MIKPNTIHSVRGASLCICLMRKTSILSLGAGQQLCSAQSMGWWAPASPLHEQPALHHGCGKSAAFQGGVGSSCREGQQEARLISLDVTEKEGPDLWLIGGKSPCSTCDSPAPPLFGWVSTVASLPGSQHSLGQSSVWSCLWLPEGAWIWFLFGFVQGHWWIIPWPRCASCPQTLEPGVRATRAAGLPCPGEQLALCCCPTLGDSGAQRYSASLSVLSWGIGPWKPQCLICLFVYPRC